MDMQPSDMSPHMRLFELIRQQGVVDTRDDVIPAHEDAACVDAVRRLALRSFPRKRRTWRRVLF